MIDFLWRREQIFKNSIATAIEDWVWVRIILGELAAGSLPGTRASPHSERIGYPDKPGDPEGNYEAKPGTAPERIAKIE
jgi:hypothetical protein